MKILKILLGLCMPNILNAYPTVGYFPPSFPRDTTEFNQALEHTLISQILEPLVTHDNEGNISPSIAKKWDFSQDSTEIIFHLDSQKKFSDGRPVKAEDVQATLDHHRFSESQSKDYLKNIEAIEIISTDTLKLKLKVPQVAILKILSRAHLGILPKGWKFSKENSEPFTGTGPYRLIKENAKWVLRKNQNYLNFPSDGIENWEIIFAQDLVQDLSKLPMVDCFPLAAFYSARIFEKDPRFKPQDYNETKRFTLMQSAAWWYPLGNNYGSETKKSYAMAAMRSLIERRRSKNKFEASTGVIPRGVHGYFAEPVKFSKPSPIGNSTQIIKVAGGPRDMEEYFAEDDYKMVEKEFNVKFDFQSFSPAFEEPVRKFKPDIYIITWMGGFFDPEGFLPVLSNALNINFEKDLGSVTDLYKMARSELSWDKRKSLYEDFNREMVKSERLVPAWKWPMLSITKKPLEENTNALRYSPSLLDVRGQK